MRLVAAFLLASVAFAAQEKDFNNIYRAAWSPGMQMRGPMAYAAGGSNSIESTVGSVESVTAPVAAIPTAPSCKIRPSTVIEAGHMRKKVSHLKELIDKEEQHILIRKNYIQKMTEYMNRRIAELNKVKTELKEGTKWVRVSKQHIASLVEEEKLIKMKDVLKCLEDRKKQSEKEDKAKEEAMKEIRTKEAEVESNLKSIKDAMKSDAATSGSS